MFTIKLNIQRMKCDYSDKRAIMARFSRSFSKGVGSIMSLNGNRIELSLGSERTDAEAIYGDWEAVGRELGKAYATEMDNIALSSCHGKTGEEK